MAKLDNTQTIFTLDGVTYTRTRTGYCYKSTGTFDRKGQEMNRRIAEAVFEKAFEDYLQSRQDEADQAEFEERKNREAEKDRKTEENFNGKTKAEKKPRRSKDIAHESNGVTLTAKQVAFIKLFPNDDFYERGLESALWIECLCDTVAGTFNPMAVGAMVSTLREKHLIEVGWDKVNGKKCKYLQFTELGKQIAKELGLN